MKKLSIALLLVSVIAVVPAFANSSSTEIIAQIGNIATITTALPTQKTIDVTSSSTDIGTMTIQSSTTGTWNVTLHSAYGGFMKGDTYSEHYAYTVTLKITSPTTVTLLDAASLGSDKTGSYTGSGTFNLSLTANYTPAASLSPLLSPDTYRDTITITVTAS